MTAHHVLQAAETASMGSGSGRKVGKVVTLILLHRKEGLKAALSGREIINGRCGLGMTPLYASCYALWPEAVERLLVAGADPFLGPGAGAVEAAISGGRDAQGQADLTRNRRASDKAMVLCIEVLNLLHARGAKVDLLYDRRLNDHDRMFRHMEMAKAKGYTELASAILRWSVSRTPTLHLAA